MRTLLALVLVAISVCAWGQSPPLDRVLHGELNGRDNNTYRTVDFSYSGPEQNTQIDLGLLGPEGFKGQDGFRGWSGGSKQVFTVSNADATPPYLPGPVWPERWTSLPGIPDIRKDAYAGYTAHAWFPRSAATAWGPGVLNPPLRQQAGWCRDDLHMHGAHGDGSCTSQSRAKRVPCPLFLTV